MKRTLFALLSFGLFSGIAYTQVNIVDSKSSGPGEASLTDGYSQNFNSLPVLESAEEQGRDVSLAWEHNKTLPGWYYSMSMSRSAITSAGKAITAPRFINYGSVGSTDRAIGVRGDSKPKSDAAFGVLFVNNTKKPISGIKVSYTGEQWRQHGQAESILEFSYKTLGRAYKADTFNPRMLKDCTRVSDLDFPAMRKGNGMVLNGKASENRKVFKPVTITFSRAVRPSEAFTLRWYYPSLGMTGQGLAIDDLKVEFITQ